MPGQIRQSRISGLLEDEYMINLKKPGRRGRRPGRRYTAPWPAALLSARCGRHAKNSEIIQAAEDRYLEMFACELEEFIVAGDLRGWYGHLKGGWKLQGKKLRSAQYIRDENGKLRRDPCEVETIFHFLAQHDLGHPQSNNYRGPIAKADSPVTRRLAGCE